MNAYVISNPGGPQVLEFQKVPDPVAQKGQAHIRIKAFGLNRAEAVTRMGGSGTFVPFPRIIGIECVGEVIDCPGGELAVGQKVAAAMGEMGRQYDGSYAEQTVVPVSNVFPIETTLDWPTFGAIPETYFTAWGCCFEALKLGENPRVVVRPGASALGIAITQIVNHLGGQVIGVTRSPHKVERLKAAGMHEVMVSREAIADQVKQIWPEGATGVVDTIASKNSLQDDFNMKASGARICVAGSLAESYKTEEAADGASIFKHPDVGFYNSGLINVEKDGQNLQTIISRVEAGIYKPHIDSTFGFGGLVKAHEMMDANAFAGKVVVNVDA